MTDGLPPYRPTAHRRTEVRVEVNTSANASDNASEPPVYDGRDQTQRPQNEEIDNKNLVYRPIANNPNDPPPDYFAAASTDCPHWVQRRCRLTARPRHCCSCMDSRDESEDGRYPVYMDGYAEPGTVVRWAHYCDECRAAECREHNDYDTSARPPGARRYKPSGNEQARAAKELADAKAAFASGNGDGDSWFRWETSGQKKERARRERVQRRDEGRQRYDARKAADAAKKKEADDLRKDAAWESDQLQRLSRGEPVSGLTVRRHFLSTNDEGKGKGKGKGKEKEKETKKVVGIYREYPNPSYEEGESSIQITPADVRAARLAWEESVEEERHREEREEERKLEVKKKRERGKYERHEKKDENKDEKKDEKKKDEKKDEKQKHETPNEYLAYGDGAEVHRSVSRTISREENRRRSLGTTDSRPWYSRLFRRWAK